MSVVAQINELKEQRASLWEDNKELLMKAESEERDLTSEEAQEYDKREADMDSLGKRADRLEKMNGARAEEPAADPAWRGSRTRRRRGHAAAGELQGVPGAPERTAAAGRAGVPAGVLPVVHRAGRREL